MFDADLFVSTHLNMQAAPAPAARALINVTGKLGTHIPAV
jgi:hypothetical protein